MFHRRFCPVLRDLSLDCYGNFTVQSIIQDSHDRRLTRCCMAHFVLPHVVLLAQHKEGSHVAEAMVKYLAAPSTFLKEKKKERMPAGWSNGDHTTTTWRGGVEGMRSCASRNENCTRKTEGNADTAARAEEESEDENDDEEKEGWAFRHRILTLLGLLPADFPSPILDDRPPPPPQEGKEASGKKCVSPFTTTEEMPSKEEANCPLDGELESRPKKKSNTIHEQENQEEDETCDTGPMDAIDPPEILTPVVVIPATLDLLFSNPYGHFVVKCVLQHLFVGPSWIGQNYTTTTIPIPTHTYERGALEDASLFSLPHHTCTRPGISRRMTQGRLLMEWNIVRHRCLDALRRVKGEERGLWKTLLQSPIPPPPPPPPFFS